ncbi:uncharacterized protein LOC135846289 isoform X2 [Planococcus citri]|uniref:uncharacterized protein LOC135846289 isoform X2 n=1 Tax=Planococcus citri TaxID=170843 RepID=UPI0031F7489D
MAPSIMYHKGLLNGPGQNNCFLNSAVQVLWHLDIFRRSFRELSGHACMSESCIFCALKDLFGQLQFSHERALPPDALRKALAQSFSDQQRFQLGFMDDAAECFENILLRIHFHIAYSEVEDMCNAKHCIPHQKFAMTLVEQSICKACNATSEPLTFTQMVHYVSASALISQAKQMNGSSHPDLFGQLLNKAGGMGDIRDCPSSCGAKIQIRRMLMNRPEIVSVGIVWDSDRPSLEHIMSLLDTLRVHLRLSDVFHGTFDHNQDQNDYHQLVGVVTYYGKHYSTFFFHTKLRVWVYFDDANVREVGPHWEHVVDKCRRGRYQPLLLLFAAPSGTPVDASNAPKTITMVEKPTMNLRNGHDMVGKPPIQRSSLSPNGSLALGGRRSLTPSPEKPRCNGDMTQRRAVTPNPEQSPGHVGKPVLPNNDYQNLLHFQEAVFNRYNGCENDDQRQDNIEKYNQPVRKELVRRDSGNWSGDRNSASSSSSTSLENPYHYIIGKMHQRSYGGVPRSPNKTGDGSSGSGNSSGGPADPGYDSFSLSSTDSLPLQQTLKHNFQLAQIPEGHQSPNCTTLLREQYENNNRVADDCERLCAEVDQLLSRSENAEDLLTALSLCNAAVNKARAAMDAPYSNPQTASFARMKHNACVMRARTLHRRLEEPLHNNLKYGEARHSREGSGCSNRGSTGSHSRQNSKDKTHSHSRQNSQDLLDLSVAAQPKGLPDTKILTGKSSPSKNIEIYATLPKNKKGLLSRSSTTKVKNVVEDEEYIMKERPGRSLLGNRSKSASKKEIEKRTRSEERNVKNTKEAITVVAKEPKEKDSKKAKQEEKQNKKQHKIRRKLLMGGLMRRKNRSMPDLREDQDIAKDSSSKPAPKEVSKDDSMLNSNVAIQSNLSGYLSEGNLEYAGNPNLERSKLMRKSFHGSKILQFNKVPPPPPLRTTSQLSKTDRQYQDPSSSQQRPQMEQQVYANHRSWIQEPASLPYMPRGYESEKPKTDAITYSNGGYMLHDNSAANTVVTEAQVHHEPPFQSLPPSIDEPDFHSVNKPEDMFQLPPYPSPHGSTVHSRQASEDFPPPPATLPLPPEITDESSFLSMLQEKREKLMASMKQEAEEPKKPTGGESWLKELQAKQAERRKCAEPVDSKAPYPPPVPENKHNFKDLKSKFEQLHVEDEPKQTHYPSCLKDTLQSSRSSPNLKHDDFDDKGGFDSREPRRKSGKKKNVTFCEQVVLVATADDDEADSYIPNPILERVLRTVLNKEPKEAGEVQERAVHSVVPLKRTDSWKLSQGLPLKPYNEGDTVDGAESQKEAAKQIQNSMKIASDVTSKPPLGRPPCTNDCPTDEVDGPSFSAPPASSQYGHENGRSVQSVRNGVSNTFGNVPANSYSPTYIPASSLCSSSTNNKSNETYRNEYPEPISLQNEQPHSSYNGYSANNDYYADQNTSNDGYVSSHSRKFNDGGFSGSRDNVRYSPICNQDNGQAIHNGYHGLNHDQSHPHPHSGYQQAPSPSYQSQSYQPMSLQYYPSQNIRSSPQIHREPYHPPKPTQYQNGSHHSSSLTRQNSNASHYNRQQVSPQSPRRTGMLGASGRPAETQRPGYNGHQYPAKHPVNGVSPYQPIPTSSTSYNGYAEKSSPSLSTSSYQSGSSSNDSLSRTSASGISPYQAVPHSSPHYGANNGEAAVKSSPYQHVPYNSPVAQQSNSSSNYHAMQSKPTSSSHRNSLPPVYHHPPPPPATASTNGYPNRDNQLPQQLNQSSNYHPMPTQPSQNSPNTSNNYSPNYQSSQSSPNTSANSLNGYQHSQSYQNTSTNGYQHSNPNYQHPPQHPSQSSAPASVYQHPPQNANQSTASPNAYQHSPQSHSQPSASPSVYQHPPQSHSQPSASPNVNQHTPQNLNHSSGSPSVYQHPPHNPNQSSGSPSVYQHPPHNPNQSSGSSSVYQHPPQNANQSSGAGNVYQHPAQNQQQSSVYQRVPTPNQQNRISVSDYNLPPNGMKYSPYQHPPPPKQQFDVKKGISMNGSNVVPCNLCRKKQISPPSVYCNDCDFYISRFKQKT